MIMMIVEPVLLFYAPITVSLPVCRVLLVSPDPPAESEPLAHL